MKIAVIAAQGRSGQAFVMQALAAGHSVRAGIRGTSRLTPHSNLITVQCDATKKEDLATLFTGQDAVVSLIGHVKGSPVNVQTTAIAVTIQTMQELGMKRIVSLTGTGVRFPGDKITFLDYFLNFGVTLIDPARVKDGIDHVRLLKKSNLDWTIIRVLKLQNIPPKPFHLTGHGPTKTLVGREEVASAILQVLSERSFVQQAPILSK